MIKAHAWQGVQLCDMHAGKIMRNFTGSCPWPDTLTRSQPNASTVASVTLRRIDCLFARISISENCPASAALSLAGYTSRYHTVDCQHSV